MEPMLTSYRYRLLPLAILASLTLLAVPPAWAADEECEAGLDSFGRCDDRKTVSWCEDGAYYQAKCPTLEICAPSAAGFGYTCIDRDATECADIPAEGACPSTEVVVYCVNGIAKSFQCDGDDECGWSATTKAYDCVAKGQLVGDTGPETAPDRPPEPGPDVVSGPDQDPELTADATTPTVKQGPANLPQPPSDCSGGRPPSAWWVVLLAWLWLRPKHHWLQD